MNLESRRNPAHRSVVERSRAGCPARGDRGVRRGRFHRIVLGLVLLLPALLLACDEVSTGPLDPPGGESQEIGVVLSSTAGTLTIFDTEDPEAPVRTVELGIPDGTPVGFSIRGELALVPMGVWPTAAVVDLRAGVVVRTIPLPEGSGATGSLFLDDSTALVANPDRGTVSRVDVLAGTAEPERAVGRYPQAFVEVGDRVVVVDSELGPDFEPLRNGTLAVLDRESLQHLETIELSGENSGPAVSDGQGTLYVLNGGRWGEGNGSLSTVDVDAREEVAHHTGFGDFPNGLARGADGDIYVSSWDFGMLVWDPGPATFVRGLGDAVTPDGVGSVAGLGVDGDGRLYTLFPECETPSRAIRLDAGYEEAAEVPVDACPSAIRFTTLGPG